MPITILSGAIKYKKNGNFNALDCIKGDPATGPVQDVQVNGASILNDGVANIPYASTSEYGLVKRGRGLFTDSNTGALVVDFAGSNQIQQGTNTSAVMGIAKQHESAFYGLAKAAGSDLANETITLGQYPDATKAAIAQMLGVGQLYGPMEEIVRVPINENLTTITVNTDKDGLPFKLAHAQIIHKIGIPTTSTRDYIRADFYDQDNNVKSLPTLQIAVAGASTNWNVYTFHAFGGMAYSLGKACSSGNAQNVQQATYTATTTDGITNITSITALTGVKFHQYDSTKTLIPAGGEIIIYGCRVIE